MVDNLRNRRHICGDDRHPRGARLREHHRQKIPEGGQGEDIAGMVEILQGLAIGFKIVIDKNTWLRRQAIFSHQVKLELQVSERAKGLQEH